MTWRMLESSLPPETLLPLRIDDQCSLIVRRLLRLQVEATSQPVPSEAMSSHGDSADHEQSGSPIDICQWIGFCNPTKNTPYVAGNQNVTGKSASSVAHLLLGPEGSEVSITVLRNQDETTDQPQQLKFHLKRQRTDTAAARIAVKNAINERLEPFR
eukprot:756215-Hanusia_phi.AAC.8